MNSAPFVLSLSKHVFQHTAASFMGHAPFDCLPAAVAQDRLRQAQGERVWLWPLVLALALAACSESKTDHPTLAKVEAEQKAIRDDDGRIACAQGQGDITRACTVDREQTDAGLILTVRHPNGAFHRLLVTKDGRGVIAADGAEQAQVTVRAGNEIEVALGGDRYRLPATVKP